MACSYDWIRFDATVFDDYQLLNYFAVYYLVTPGNLWNSFFGMATKFGKSFERVTFSFILPFPNTEFFSHRKRCNGRCISAESKHNVEAEKPPRGDVMSAQEHCDDRLTN